MIVNLKELVLIEFSLSQNCFHTHSLADAIATNFKNVMERKQTDFIAVGVVESYEEATVLIDVLKQDFKIKEYSMYQTTNGNLIVK